MSPRGPRHRVAKNIYRDAYGLAAVVKVQGQTREKRFLPDTPLRTLRTWIKDTRATLRSVRPRLAHGTLAADVPVYLKLKESRLGFLADRQRDLEAWLPAFGARARGSLSPHELQLQLNAWRHTLSASTCNHRHVALSNVFTVLDGRNAWNPLREVPLFETAALLPRALDYDTQIRPTLAVMRESASKARCLILAFCGFRPSQIARTPPEYVLPFLDLPEPYVLMPAGKRGSPVAQPLAPEGMQGWRMLAQCKAWGSFSVASLNKRWQAAMKRAQLAPTNVYTLRHSWATRLLGQTDDLSLVQKGLGHRKLETTRRYTYVMVDPRLRKAVLGAFPDKEKVKSPSGVRLAPTAGSPATS